jgi:hypothetical protein
MAWVKAAEFMPPEDEQILIYDERNSRAEFGRYIGGRWFIENIRNGQLSIIEEVTHWAPMLDSETNDTDDD